MMTTTDHDLQAQIAAAQAYEALHVPALFRPWSPWVLDAVRIRSGQRVLDLACGTGVLASAAQTRVGPAGFVAGIDPDVGMLTVARTLAPSIEWRQGWAETLLYPDQAFDAVVSQFGLMFFKDRILALREALRVLAPEGVLGVAVWDRLENSGPYSILVDLLERMAGDQAADALRAPFALGDVRELRSLFESAGATSIVVATHRGIARFPSVRSMVEADLRGWLPVMGVVLEEELIERILQEAESALRPYVTAQGEVVFDSPGHIVTALKPKQSQ